MEKNDNAFNDKKSVSKVRSFNSPQSIKLTCEACKRKSYDVNGAVRSLDLALGRLKKSKLVNDEYRQMVTGATESAEMFMDICNSNQQYNQGIENASLMSMNFSQYELLRNLSCSNCNSDGEFSDNTCSVVSADMNLKDEQLERYFRSIEMWSRNHRDAGSSDIQFERAEK